MRGTKAPIRQAQGRRRHEGTKGKSPLATHNWQLATHLCDARRHAGTKARRGNRSLDDWQLATSSDYCLLTTKRAHVARSKVCLHIGLCRKSDETAQKREIGRIWSHQKRETAVT